MIFKKNKRTKSCNDLSQTISKLNNTDPIDLNQNKKYYSSDSTSDAISFPFRVKDPGSALTHFIAFITCIFLMPMILTHIAAHGAKNTALISVSIFMLSMILLYGASSAYHTFNISKKANKILRKIDHMMIFVLIAGSYTPVCLLALANRHGVRLLAFVWIIAVVGIALTGFWVNCPKWISSIIYIAMGWSCISSVPQIVSNLSKQGFLWLLAGGIIYTLGGIIYAMKFQLFRNRFQYIGAHEIFHVFVMGGSLCHFILMYYLPIH